MNDLELLKDSLPLYLERYLADNITRKGNNSFQLHCPFHQDKTPSFIADRKQGTWLFHCFSCGAAGSVIDLHLRLNDSLPSSQSIASTAQALGIQLTNTPLSKAEKQQWVEHKRRSTHSAQLERLAATNKQRVTEHIQNAQKRLLEPYLVDSWRIALLDASPLNFDTLEAVPRDFIKCLFPPSSTLWLGNPMDTGKPHHSAQFKTCSQWLKQATLPPRIAAGTFIDDCCSRSLANIHSSLFIILESDDLIGKKPETAKEKEHNKSLSYALIQYAQDKLGLELCAVIDTGNKSLHAWFKRPPDRALEALSQLADGLSLDRGVIERGAALPLRLPNTIHEATGIPARLLYLQPQTF